MMQVISVDRPRNAAYVWWGSDEFRPDYPGVREWCHNYEFDLTQIEAYLGATLPNGYLAEWVTVPDDMTVEWRGPNG